MKNEQTWVDGILKLGIREKSRSDKVISASQAGKYLTCPRAWSLRYIHKKKLDKPSIHLAFGNAMHEVLQEWLKVIYTRSVKASESMDLGQMLKLKLREHYINDVKNNNGEHFSNPEELAEFYGDGIEILKFIKSKRRAYFTTKKMKLVGIELPLMYPPDEDKPNVLFMGFIDLVFYNEATGKYLVIDIKTSTRGWSPKAKKDKTKTDQVLLYKRYMAEQYGLDEANIEVAFFIVRRKVNPDSMWPMKRVQEFTPASGKPSMNKATRKIEKFVAEAFNADGSFNTDREYPAIKGVSGWNCTFCPYKDREDLCPSAERKTANL